MTTYNYIFEANIVIKGKIECKTGLHIGGSKEKLEIGGVDSPVIRNPRNRYPYIPGTSIKGKMRTLLEFSLGVVSKGQDLKNIGDVSKDDKIVRLFGIGANDKEKNEFKDIGPTRLIVRDCNPDNFTIDMWEKMDTELLYTEFKPENTINRLTSAANPRFIERVVEGSRFDFEIIYGVYNMDEKDNKKKVNEDLANLLEGLRLLEHSAIGAAGSRGYGQIKFYLSEPLIIKADDYKTGTGNYQKLEEQTKKIIQLTYDLSELKDLSQIKLEY